MANVLFTWELGSGLGHLMQMAPLANALARGGHRVFAAVRDVGRAPTALDRGVRLLPASFAVSRGEVGWTWKSGRTWKPGRS